MSDILDRIKFSKFRSSFHLKKTDIEYIDKIGMERIKSHAYDFINKRLKPFPTPNDGKQTPMKGHPVFLAQHATGCCCRGCLYKWHKISQCHELTGEEVDYIVGVLMEWIESEYNKK